MKKFLTRLIILLVIAILPNLLLGILRLNAGDHIPYVINRDKSLVTPEEKEVKIPYQLKTVIPVADMSRQKISKELVWRSVDQFGFSNIIENKSPEILFTGDSFFNDPHTNTAEGMQAGVNKRIGKNIAYNIGKSECAGFKVYNELSKRFFEKKPGLIVFEVIERNCYEAIIKAPAELRNNTFKTIPYSNYFADLVFGNNFENLDKSRLFNKEPALPVIGHPRMIGNRKVWFLNDRTTYLADYEINNMVDSMKLISSMLAQQHIHIVFMMAPDKESTYPSLFGTSVIKTLQDKMKEQQVDYINMLGALENKGLNYYYDEDTHWNKAAVNLLCDSVVQKYNFIFHKTQ